MDLVLLSLEESSIGNVYDFLVDYNSVNKPEILNIYKYLVTKDNKK